MRLAILMGSAALLACQPPAPASSTPSGETPAASSPAAIAPTTLPTSLPTIAEGSGVRGADSAPTEPLNGTPAEWINERVESARMRMASSPAGQIVWRGVEAHGGLQAFFEHSPWQFRFNYVPLGDRPPTDTVQVVDAWSARAVHHLTSDPQVSFGWDGTTAWVAPGDATPVRSPRFWALTPWYFVAIPWVLADPGVTLDLQPDAVLADEPCHVVRVTFAEGVGDAPDDYYIVYFSQETGLVRGLRYTVSYPAFFPNGGRSPEKLMLVQEVTATAGLLFAGALPTYEWSDEAGQGERVTDISVSDMTADVTITTDTFAMPSNGAPFNDLAPD